LNIFIENSVRIFYEKKMYKSRTLHRITHSALYGFVRNIFHIVRKMSLTALVT